ncbi:MAG: DmsC/YnfH family molybdoenzyme membrane anchor subunit [Pirellulales bacterium]
MSIAPAIEPTAAQEQPEIARPLDLLGELLAAQQSTAVEKFSRWHGASTHETPAEPLQARYYRDLIPLSLPKAGEQFAFEVDLDGCSGCKACVVACHNLNGLEESEMWRSVGLLHGGSSELPVLQHVTTACHHCLEPACLDGCPVNAYEKDCVTGIVRHLDDQCIGCQYCVLKCPYDVPKYSASKGIVRKCDMCSDRLAVGEAPACVQACPNQAIRITVVSKHAAAENAEANLFLPGAPEPGYTLPTTVYKTARPLPGNMLPADYYSASPQHAHWPLVVMLVLTQMSVGAFLVDQIVSGVSLAAGLEAVPAERSVQLAAAFLLGMLGLAAATLHLGRPLLAYRAIIGWRTSWLSREVLAFGAFAAAATAYAAMPWLEAAGLPISATWERIAGATVAVTGLAGVACSTMIYASTRRAFWNPAYTGIKFLLTCLVLGIPVSLLMRLGVAVWSARPSGDWQWPAHTNELVQCLLAAVAAKLMLEGAVFSWLRARTFTPLRRTAILMSGSLGGATSARFIVGTVGGLLVPAVLLAWMAQPEAVQSVLVLAAALSVLALNFVGELLERYLFFAAVVAPKMPGAPTA